MNNKIESQLGKKDLALRHATELLLCMAYLTPKGVFCDRLVSVAAQCQSALPRYARVSEEERGLIQSAATNAQKQMGELPNDSTNESPA